MEASGMQFWQTHKFSMHKADFSNNMYVCVRLKLIFWNFEHKYNTWQIFPPTKSKLLLIKH